MCHNHYIIVIKSAAKVILPKNMIPPLLMNDSIAAIAFFHSLKSLVIFTLNNLFPIPILNLIQCLTDIGQQIIDMLCTYRQTDGRRRDVLGFQFLGRKL